MNTPFARRVVKGSLVLGLSSYLGFALTFVTQLLLARWLVPEMFGIYALALGVTELVFVGSTLVSVSGCLRYQREERMFSTAVRLSWLVGFVLATLLAGGALLYVRWFGDQGTWQVIWVLLALAAGRWVELPAQIYSAWLEKDLKFGLPAAVTFAGVAFSCAVALGGAWVGWGVWSLVAREVCYSVLVLVLLWLYVAPRMDKGFNGESARRLLAYGRGLIVQRLSSIAYTRLPFVVMGKWAGAHITGLFERATYLSKVPNRLAEPITHRVSLPVYAAINESGQRLGRALFWHAGLVIRWSLPVALVTALYAEELVLLLLGDQWRDSVPYLRALALWIGLRPVWAALVRLCQAAGWVREVTVGEWIGIAGIVCGALVSAATGGDWVWMAWAISAFAPLQALWLVVRLAARQVRPGWGEVLLKPVVLALVAVPLMLMLHETAVLWYWQLVAVGVVWTAAIAILDARMIREVYTSLRG